MHVYTFDCRMVSPRNPEETFRLFENPYNLARITPRWLGFRILTPGLEMREGLEIHYEFRWLGAPLRWTTLITAYQPPHFFVDEAVQGPYALWRHRHTFTPCDSGTTVADHVDYALPFGPLGRLAHPLVSRQVRAIFAYRQKAIAELFKAQQY